MKLFSESQNYKLYNGDMLDMLEVIPKNSIDAIVTDPPYEIGFMNKSWDSTGIAYNVEAWKKCLQVLKPGGYMLVFGSARSHHRVTCAIEDAGFRICDCIMWVFGSGMPKGMNIGLALDKRHGIESKPVSVQGTLPDFNDAGSKNSVNKIGVNDGESADRVPYVKYEAQNEWNGWNTQLKPAYEAIILAQKPCDGTILENVETYGVGGINVDECRIPFEDTKDPATNPLYRKENGYKINYGVDSDPSSYALKHEPGEMNIDSRGRFPANIILTYDDESFEEVCGGFPNTKSTGGSGEASRTSTTELYSGGWNPDKICAHLGGLGDEGSAARYFYCAKASVRDREEGIDGKEEEVRVTNQYEMPRENGTIRNVPKKKNNHPSVKPVDLMCYLVRLITPNGGTILDPFNGSGSTGKATMYENNDHNKGYKYIGIELDEHYCDISRARIEYAESDRTKITEVGSETKSNPVTKVVGIKAKKFFEI